METIKELMDYLEEILPFVCILLPSYALMSVLMGYQPSIRDAFLTCLAAVPLRNIYDFIQKEKRNPVC